MQKALISKMKAAGILALAVFVLLGIASSAAAQTGSSGSGSTASTASSGQTGNQKPDGDTTRRELANFDKYLDKHPEVAEQLRKDPNLINNKEWVEKHPELQEWLKNHPHAREELKENPKAFMNREKKFEKHEGKHPGKNAAKH
jgi:hypothetical protein